MLLGASVWQHFFSEPGYRAFLWDDFWTGWAVKILTGLEWRDFLMSPAADSMVSVFTKTMAAILSLGFVAAILISPKRLWMRWFLYASTAVLALQAFGSFLDVSYQVPMLMELSLRVGAPTFLALTLTRGWTPGIWIAMIIATGLTFSGHGLYASGLGVPVPGNFVDMVMESLALTQGHALELLMVAGLLDQVIVLGMFFQLSRQWSLIYATCWGFLTAFARLTSYVRFDVIFLTSLLTYLPEFLIRTPHYLIPLALLNLDWQKLDKHDSNRIFGKRTIFRRMSAKL